ncbi:14245_t:CDS:1 [Cetraspora pellucida]|uniref:14245_t:CDS:1 n=1 Tax=Cetraspora pellucida TaxID=1433469 RepID=A0ACA9LA23_9GLOM|nr:14245_t:CDS:1 [Cetraspora pellucida]
MKAKHWLEEQDSLEIIEYNDNSENSLSEDEHIYHQFLNIEENQRSPCVIINNLKREIRCCNSINNLRSVSQLVETWEIELTQEENSNIATLGICSSHFNFDQNKLYSSNAKQIRDSSQSVIKIKKCLLCNKYKNFFSKDDDCEEHN